MLTVIGCSQKYTAVTLKCYVTTPKNICLEHHNNVACLAGYIHGDKKSKTRGLMKDAVDRLIT